MERVPKVSPTRRSCHGAEQALSLGLLGFGFRLYGLGAESGLGLRGLAFRV